MALVVPLSLFVLCLFGFSEQSTVGFHRIEVGRFTNDRPFNNLPIPENPNVYQPKFYLYKEGIGKGEPISPQGFNGKGVTVLVHGFTSSHNASKHWAAQFAEAIYNMRGAGDVLFYDWHGGAKWDYNLDIRYKQAASNTRTSGAYLAKFLKENLLFDPLKAHCIGHSLGGHVCGFAGKTLIKDTGKPWGRITGMDAAGPSFENQPAEARLDIGDAMFVQDIHTSTMYGLKMAVGYVDFYVNGGVTQPGCNDLKTFGTCSHSRVMDYVRATFNYPEKACDFKFCRCASKADFDAGKCDTCWNKGDINYLGMQANRNNPGIFYGRTSETYPYCFDRDKAKPIGKSMGRIANRF